jgi:hypothetical protein
MNSLHSIIENSLLELTNLMKVSNYVFDGNQFDKVMDILYELIPHQTITELNKMHTVVSLIEISTICLSMTPSSQFNWLFDILFSKLMI